MRIWAVVSFILLTSSYVWAESLCSKEAAELKVSEICEHIKEIGKSAMKNWPRALLFENCGDNYVWVQDTSQDIRMIMHPIKRRMDGTSLRYHKDEKGFKLFVEFDRMAKLNPQGAWVEYVWAKPGSDQVTPKASFVKLCKMKDGSTWVTGSGVWKDDLLKPQK